MDEGFLSLDDVLSNKQKMPAERLLRSTRAWCKDDAVECFEKVAREIGLQQYRVEAKPAYDELFADGTHTVYPSTPIVTPIRTLIPAHGESRFNARQGNERYLVQFQDILPRGHLYTWHLSVIRLFPDLFHGSFFYRKGEPMLGQLSFDAVLSISEEGLRDMQGKDTTIDIYSADPNVKQDPFFAGLLNV